MILSYRRGPEDGTQYRSLRIWKAAHDAARLERGGPLPSKITLLVFYHGSAICEGVICKKKSAALAALFRFLQSLAQNPDALVDQVHLDALPLGKALGQLGIVNLHDDGLILYHHLVLYLGAVVGGAGDAAGQLAALGG